jgi:hydroxypyruvate isomerase
MRPISNVRSDKLFVRYEIYHMQVMEGDLARTMRSISRIAHIQLATIQAATNRAPARSTILSCSGI